MHMKIKDILRYDFHYAEFVVTDGKHDLVLMCHNVPHYGELIPAIGTGIKSLSVLNYQKEFELKKIEDKDKQKYAILKGKTFYEYILRGKVIDPILALVMIEGFLVSLKNHFELGLPKSFKINDFVEFTADRLDASII